MKIVIGLGNPQEKYRFTRHNAGFLALDELRKNWDFPNFKMEKKFQAEISRGKLKDQNVLLVKPQTFMNLSGNSVRTILDFFKLTPTEILVIHDDLDIELGKFKLSPDSRSAGHNGAQNIIDALGTQKFRRLRLGIAKTPEEKEACPLSGHDYVLGKFSKKELEKLKKVFEKVPAEIEKFLS